AGKRRVLLDGELIERKMLACLDHGACELGCPGLRRLARPCIDQTERIAVEDRARERARSERLARRVQPPELFERAIVQRLHAERHAVAARRAKSAKARRLDA